jgi:septum formation protein
VAAVAGGTGRLTLGDRLAPLVLASASPRRRELLGRLGLVFEQAPVEIDESPREGESALETCRRLAGDKARAAASRLRRGTVLGSDTLVVLDGVGLGKPADEPAAREMLSALAGRRHQVASSVALLHVPSGRLLCEIDVAEVEFEPLAGDWLGGYLSSGEWRDKAGAYGIQGQAGAFARLVDGDLETVVGLPTRIVTDLLRAMEEITR